MERAKKRFDYNTVLVILCFFITFFGLGLWGPKGLFVKPITEALGIERSLYSLSDTMRYIATAIVSVFFGRLLGRFGTKWIVSSGFLLMAVAAVLYALAEGLFLFYLGGVLTGVGLCLTGTSLIAYVINKACKRGRGTVMGLILAANGVGSAVASPIVSAIINEEGNPFGYRNAFYLMAAIFACMCLLLLLLFREPTEAEGDAEAPTPRRGRGIAWVGIEYAEAKRKAYFYGVCAVILLTSFITQGVSGCSLPYLSDMSMSAELVAMISGLSSLLLGVFKIVDGILYDSVGLRAVMILNCLSFAGAIVCLLLVTGGAAGTVLAVAYSLLSAIGLPLSTVIIPILANEFFGERDYNKILGIFVAIGQMGIALGTPLMNLFYDVSGSYHLGFLLCIPTMVAVVVLYQFITASAERVRRDILREAGQKTGL